MKLKKKRRLPSNDKIQKHMTHEGVTDKLFVFSEDFFSTNSVDIYKMLHYARLGDTRIQSIMLYQVISQCVLVYTVTVYSKTCVKKSRRNRQNKDLNDKW